MAEVQSSDRSVNPTKSNDLTYILQQFFIAKDALSFIMRLPNNGDVQQKFRESIHQTHVNITKISEPSKDIQQIAAILAEVTEMINDDLQEIRENIQDIKDSFADLDALIKQQFPNELEKIEQLQNSENQRFGMSGNQNTSTAPQDEKELQNPKFTK